MKNVLDFYKGYKTAIECLKELLGLESDDVDAILKDTEAIIAIAEKQEFTHGSNDYDALERLNDAFNEVVASAPENANISQAVGLIRQMFELDFKSIDNAKNV